MFKVRISKTITNLCAICHQHVADSFKATFSRDGPHSHSRLPLEERFIQYYL